jgi:hypothetical protein
MFLLGSGFAYANFIRKLTVEKEIYFEDSHIKKTFNDVSNLQEMWQWVHGVSGEISMRICVDVFFVIVSIV